MTKKLTIPIAQRKKIAAVVRGRDCIVVRTRPRGSKDALPIDDFGEAMATADIIFRSNQPNFIIQKRLFLLFPQSQKR